MNYEINTDTSVKSDADYDKWEDFEGLIQI